MRIELESERFSDQLAGSAQSGWFLLNPPLAQRRDARAAHLYRENRANSKPNRGASGTDGARLGLLYDRANNGKHKEEATDFSEAERIGEDALKEGFCLEKEKSEHEAAIARETVGVPSTAHVAK